MNTIRIAAPKTARRGEIIELKALIRHPMESGFRRGASGEVIAREFHGIVENYIEQRFGAH